MKALKIEYIKTEELKEYEKNAKIHTPEQIEQIKKSIEEFGMNDPIAVWKDNVIIEGHGRLMACKELGIPEVPVIRLDDLTDEQRKAYMNVHNQLTMNTGFDLEVLIDELNDITTIDMDAFGFDFLKTDEDVEVEEDEYEVQLPEKPKTKAGQVLQLGKHRLICGDSTDERTLQKLTSGEEMDLLMTDPPYNVNYESKAGKIENDDMAETNFIQFLVDAFTVADHNLKEGGSFYIWHADNQGWPFRDACKEVGWQIRQCLIWNKNTFTLGRQDYQWKHEPCLYGWKDGGAHYFTDERKNGTVIEDKALDISKMKKEELAKTLREILEAGISTTVINENKPLSSDLHPTMKPIKLIAPLIKNSSRPGEKVLDIFGGSGSTMIACEQLDRQCYMVELDPHYCDVIIERWEKYTGEKAELVSE